MENLSYRHFGNNALHLRKNVTNTSIFYLPGYVFFLKKNEMRTQ